MTKEEKRKYQREYMRNYRKGDKYKKYYEDHKDELTRKEYLRNINKMNIPDLWYSTERLEKDTNVGFFRSYRVNYYEENYRDED